MAEFKTILEDAWFEPFAAQPFPGKGFKHVFIGKYLITLLHVRAI